MLVFYTIYRHGQEKSLESKACAKTRKMGIRSKVLVDKDLWRTRPARLVLNTCTQRRTRVTGLEPATSSVTGWRSNQLIYTPINDPTGIRTPINGTKIRCPKPLDDRAKTEEVGFEPTDQMNGRRFSKPVH